MKITSVMMPSYLQKDYKKRELHYPMLNLSSAVAIRYEIGRDFGFGDKDIFGIVVNNELYVVFKMDDIDVSIQRVFIYDLKNKELYHSSVNWLTADDQPINMIEHLADYFNAFASIINLSPIENVENFASEEIWIQEQIEDCKYSQLIICQRL